MHYQRENIADFIRSIAGYRGDGCCGRRCLCSERYACARKGNPVTNMSLIVRLRPQGQPYCGARTSVKGSAIQRIAACIKRERERRYSLSIRKAQSTATSAAPIIFARCPPSARYAPIRKATLPQKPTGAASTSIANPTGSTGHLPCCPVVDTRMVRCTSAAPAALLSDATPWITKAFFAT